MDLTQLFHGPNAGYLSELYESYQTDPSSVDESVQKLFALWSPTDEVVQQNGAATKPTGVAPQPANGQASANIAGVVNLASAIRQFGDSAANISPIAPPNAGDPAMQAERYGLNDEMLRNLPASVVKGPVAESAANAFELIEGLRRIYTGSIGYDYRHIANADERAWLRDSAESRRFHPDNLPLDNQKMLGRLTQVEGFEQFLHRTFQGKKRFSIEGLDVMVPMLDEIVDGGTNESIRHLIIGMAHRGRLNVLTHVLQKPYSEMLAEFKDVMADFEDANWTGDVKYHSGRKRVIKGKNADLVVQIAANPSHLELVNPVVEGMARAAGSTANQSGEIEFDKETVLVIQIHGDAAFAGQGIVPETMNFNLLPGWRTGGTIHFIANNQVGFTTDYFESRSTVYASDVAKGYRIPIVHVNADDVEACVEAARLAFAYTNKFERDFLIDLVGYRRYGHNEGDEPRMTQPTMYRAIDAHPTVRQIWANTLVERNEIGSDSAETLFNEQLGELQTIYEQVQTKHRGPAPFVPDPQPQHKIETSVSAETLIGYNKALVSLPEGFEIHRGLKRVMKRRAVALDDLDSAEIDWGQAESLAFASILADKTPIRITGEDVERGTFSHRHAILRDMQTGDRFIPLQHIPQVKAAFQCRNSPLSENAALGFEYGYSVQAENQMVLWEAQFGDFVNGAQAIIDEYISSAKAKWQLDSGLVLLLPHGYEGQGPDHSTARLERWLGMAADRNMRIVYPTTAANYFHVLRRQAKLLQSDARPLIVMSPKSLLRHPLARSPLRDFSEGRWWPIIDDPSVTAQRKRHIKRVVLCSGKVYVDAVTNDQRPEKCDVAFIRVEQLYRFPMQMLRDLLDKYSGIEDVVWLQEEPKNAGAWNYVKPLLHDIIDRRCPVHYVGRPHRASPAEGAMAWHKINQDKLIAEAYGVASKG